MKESYIKAVAVGLAMPLEDIEFRKPVNDRFMTCERPDDVDVSARVFIKRIEKVSSPRGLAGCVLVYCCGS